MRWRTARMPTSGAGAAVVLLACAVLLVAAPAAAVTLERDVLALRALAEEVRGRDPQWKGAVKDWVGDDPCGEDWHGRWEGVSCRYQENLPADQPRVVTNLHLPKRQLTGAIPQSLALLRNLTEIDFDHNYLTGSLPPEWGCLGGLMEIDISNNRLSGTLPPQWGLLHKLVELEVDGNAQLTGCLPHGLPPFERLCGTFFGPACPAFTEDRLIGTGTVDTRIRTFGRCAERASDEQLAASLGACPDVYSLPTLSKLKSLGSVHQDLAAIADEALVTATRGASNSTSSEGATAAAAAVAAAAAATPAAPAAADTAGGSATAGGAGASTATMAPSPHAAPGQAPTTAAAAAPAAAAEGGGMPTEALPRSVLPAVLTSMLQEGPLGVLVAPSQPAAGGVEQVPGGAGAGVRAFDGPGVASLDGAEEARVVPGKGAELAPGGGKGGLVAGKRGDEIRAGTGGDKGEPAENGGKGAGGGGGGKSGEAGKGKGSPAPIELLDTSGWEDSGSMGGDENKGEGRGWAAEDEAAGGAGGDGGGEGGGKGGGEGVGRGGVAGSGKGSVEEGGEVGESKKAKRGGGIDVRAVGGGSHVTVVGPDGLQQPVTVVGGGGGGGGERAGGERVGQRVLQPLLERLSVGRLVAAMGGQRGP